MLIIVGTRPEIIRLAAVINKCRQYFDTILAHTGQNYDYNLNGVFFKDLKLADPEVYMDAVGDDLGATVGNIINCSYKLMNQIKPDALLILGDTNSCLSAIAAKRLHIPIFHMEAILFCQLIDRRKKACEVLFGINVFFSVSRKKNVFLGFKSEAVKHIAGFNLCQVLMQNLSHRRTSYIGSFFGKSALMQITTSVFGIGEVDI